MARGRDDFPKNEQPLELQGGPDFIDGPTHEELEDALREHFTPLRRPTALVIPDDRPKAPNELLPTSGAPLPAAPARHLKAVSDLEDNVQTSADDAESPGRYLAAGRLTLVGQVEPVAPPTRFRVVEKQAAKPVPRVLSGKIIQSILKKILK